MTIGENIGQFWTDLSLGHKLLVILTGLLIAAAIVVAGYGWVQAKLEVRKFEKEAAAAKQDAVVALEAAKKIAQEKLEVERKLAETEAKRDAKVTQLEQARIDTLDARRDYERDLREQRGDNPSPEQLCLELAALGYPCR